MTTIHPVSTVAFPTGTYTAEYRCGVPFVPTQHVKLIATRPREARLELRGIVNAAGSVTYDFVEGEWECQLSESLSKPLRHRRLRLEKLEYDSDGDSPHVSVHVFGVGHVRVSLKRID